MDIARMIGAAITLATIAVLALAVIGIAEGGEDWLELAAIAVVALVLGAGLFERRLPRRARPPVIRRTPESRW